MLFDRPEGAPLEGRSGGFPVKKGREEADLWDGSESDDELLLALNEIINIG